MTRLALACGLTLLGCTGGSGDPIAPIACDAERDDCAFEQNLDYPDGPYGTSLGDVIAPFTFEGYAMPALGFGPALRATISLEEFYNPTGEGIYEADDLFDLGKPKPRVLMINVAASWCPPCKDEAANILPHEYVEHGPRGLEILSILTDSDDPGIPADFGDLEDWIYTYGNEYPTAIDPTYQVGKLIDTSQYPANFLIDTRDMTIAAVVLEKPTDAFFAQLEQLLDD